VEGEVSVLRDYQSEIIDDFDRLVVRGMRSVMEKPRRRKVSPHFLTLTDAFRARAEARAALYKAGELDLHEAVDALQETAITRGLVDQIGQDAVQAIMARAFKRPK
jgi:hypothetical protein